MRAAIDNRVGKSLQRVPQQIPVRTNKSRSRSDEDAARAITEAVTEGPDGLNRCAPEEV